jgi:hypothetical protein
MGAKGVNVTSVFQRIDCAFGGYRELSNWRGVLGGSEGNCRSAVLSALQLLACIVSPFGDGIHMRGRLRTAKATSTMKTRYAATPLVFHRYQSWWRLCPSCPWKLS